MFFRAKKAQWYHMMDWKAMTNTWTMLPEDIRRRIVFDGLYGQRTFETMPGATNVAASLPQEISIQTDQMGEM